MVTNLMANQLLTPQVQRRRVDFRQAMPFMPKYIEQRNVQPVEKDAVISSALNLGGAVLNLTNTFLQIADTDRQRVANERFLAIQGEMDSFFTSMENRTDITNWKEEYEQKENDIWDTYGSDLDERTQQMLRSAYDPYALQAFNALDKFAIQRTHEAYAQSWDANMQKAVKDGDIDYTMRLIEQGIQNRLITEDQREEVTQSAVVQIQRVQARKDVEGLNKSQAYKRLNAVDENGEYVNYSALSTDDRLKLQNWHAGQVDYQKALADSQKQKKEQEGMELFYGWLTKSYESGEIALPSNYVEQLRKAGVGAYNGATLAQAAEMGQALISSFDAKFKQGVTEEQQKNYDRLTYEYTVATRNVAAYLALPKAKRGPSPLPFVLEDIEEMIANGELSHSHGTALAEFHIGLEGMINQPVKKDEQAMINFFASELFRSKEMGQLTLSPTDFKNFVDTGQVTGQTAQRWEALFTSLADVFATTREKESDAVSEETRRVIQNNLDLRAMAGEDKAQLYLEAARHYRVGEISEPFYNRYSKEVLGDMQIPAVKAGEARLSSLVAADKPQITEQEKELIEDQIVEWVRSVMWKRPGELVDNPPTTTELARGVDNIIDDAIDQRKQDKVGDRLAKAMDDDLKLGWQRIGDRNALSAMERTVIAFNTGETIGLEGIYSDSIASFHNKATDAYIDAKGNPQKVSEIPGGVLVFEDITGQEWVVDVKDKMEELITYDTFLERYPERSRSNPITDEGAYVLSESGQDLIFYNGQFQSYTMLQQQGLVGAFLENDNSTRSHWILYKDRDGLVTRRVEIHALGQDYRDVTE
jgi:hypothetical protein